MKVLITGVGGFVGSSVAHALLDYDSSLSLIGLDNFIRPGSETNRAPLKSHGVKVFHGDIRCQNDFEMIPPTDWVIDAAANPSVLAGVDRKTSSRQLIDIGDYYANFFRVRQELGWTPQHSLRDTIARTLAFYRDHLTRHISIEVRCSEQRPCKTWTH